MIPAPSLRSATRAVGRLAATTGVRAAIVGAIMAAALGAAGCQRALFPEDLPRTQFETYDKMRQRYVPLEEPDVFGTPQPALRARLGQQD